MQTQKDKSLFTDRLIAMLKGLAESLNYALPLARLEAYLIALDGISEVRLKFACVEALKNCKFFPQPSELRDFAFRWTPPEEAKPAAVFRENKPPDWQHVGRNVGFTAKEVQDMMEAAKAKQREHIRKLEGDPAWRALRDRVVQGNHSEKAKKQGWTR